MVVVNSTAADGETEQEIFMKVHSDTKGMLDSMLPINDRRLYKTITSFFLRIIVVRESTSVGVSLEAAS